MKYRTKPFEVEAVQFTGDNWDEVQSFCGTRSPDWNPDIDIPNFTQSGMYAVWNDETIISEVWDYLHQTWVGVHAGDYVIKGMKGEFYPCNPEVFESKYEEINDTVIKEGENYKLYEDGRAEFYNLVSPKKIIEEGNYDCHLPVPKEIDE